MKVDGYGNIKNSAPVRKRSGVSGTSSFADVLDAGDVDNSSAATGSAPTAATSNVAGLLALQEVSDEEVSRQKNLQHGHRLLDSLDRLRRQLLMGEVSLDALRGIEQEMAIQRLGTSDPVLTALLDDIEIRAAVELAKLEMAIAAKSVL
jgi:hypothetical protein